MAPLFNWGSNDEDDKKQVPVAPKPIVEVKNFSFDMTIYFNSTLPPLTSKSVSLKGLTTLEEVQNRIREIINSNRSLVLNDEIIINIRNVAYIDIREIKNESVL